MNLHFSTFSLAGLEKASFVVSLRRSFELERLLFGVTCRQISSADFTIVITILWYKIYIKHYVDGMVPAIRKDST